MQNDTRRVFTYPSVNHNYRAGFSFGANVTTGTADPSSYLWEYANENSAIPFTQVFVRPQISEADIAAAGVTNAPDTGIPASTVRAMLDRNPTAQPWAVTGLTTGTAVSNLNANVTAFAQVGNTIFIGGKFTAVVHGPGGPEFAQPYLAAFDKDTGEWIPSFNPVLNGPVWELKASPDGTKLFVGGEFTSVNGLPNTTALAALNPTTGVPVSDWVGYVSRPTGVYDVRAMDIQGPWLYLGGNFTRISGGVGTQFKGPITDSRLGRVRISDGQPDGAWKPSVEIAPQEISASPVGDRVYAVGLFQTLNGVALTPARLAVMNTVNGDAIPNLQPFKPNSTDSEWQNTILEVGTKVYQGGSQHILHQYNKSDYGFERSHITKPGGDFQTLAYKDGILYGGCHCTDFQYQDTNIWPDPQGYSQVDPINLIGAYDTTQNLEVIPEFHPTKIDLRGTGGEGPWEMMFDTDGCLWAGGDLMRSGTTASPYYGGYERFCDRDSTAPSVPVVRSAVTDNTVTLTWNPSTDYSTAPIKYEILKDDPTFGTIVVGSTFDRTYTDTGVTGPARYFVRALDGGGNRSATSPVVAVTPPPPAAATLLAHGDTWSYRADGQDLGSAWRAPSFDTSAWATGASQLGWGGKGETTTIPTGAITAYFVKHQTIANPSQYQTITIRLKRDDGALVYVNGVPVVSDNMPAGTITASTPASSFTSGAGETTWYEYQVPASLFVAGDNTIAAEVHQGAAANADAIFDLELVARNGTETTPPSTPAPTATEIGVTSATIGWAPATDNTAVIGYLVKRNGTTQSFTTGTTHTDTSLSPNTAYSFSVTAVDSSGNASAPGSVSISTTSNPMLIQHGDVWSYKATATDPGTSWRQPGFDASSWSTGASQLGWGNRGESTLVPTGFLTSYYLRHFTVSNPASVSQLTLRVKRDDGIAVYVNGTEVVRDNLPAGTLTAGTYSSTKVTAADGIAWKTFTVPTAALVAGDNVIAAEVHQDAKSDTRGVFDLDLAATVSPSSVPVVTIASPTAGALVTSPTTISGTCTAAAGTVTISLTGAQPGTLTTACDAGTWTASSPLGDGSYSATASQTDGSGTTGTSPATSFTVDSAAPVVTITTPAAGAILASAPTFSGACSTGDGNVTVTITGAASANLSTPCVAGAWSTTGGALGTGAYSVTAAQTDNAGQVGTSAPRSFGVDANAPSTSDNTATIGNAWKTTNQTVTLSATDTGGAGVAQTYFTTDGSTPTTASATGTTISLTNDGVYTIKYFSVDAAGNSEAVKTAGTQIRIDKAVPTHAVTFPANGSSYNATTWTAGCSPTARLCGTAADTGSGIASVRMTIRRSNNSQYWTGSAWQSASATITATGTTAWSVPLATSQLTNGVTYTVTSWSVDATGNLSANTVRTFTYDTAAPTTSAASIVTANKNGAINVNTDTFAVTFNEALAPASVPATATLTLSRSNGSTSYGISGLTNGLRTTGSTGYLTSSGSTRTVTFSGTLVLSNSNKTVTFKVTGACAGSCTALSTTKVSGAYQYVPATTLRDVAGNAPSTSTITASSQTIF